MLENRVLWRPLNELYIRRICKALRIAVVGENYVIFGEARQRFFECANYVRERLFEVCISAKSNVDCA